MDTRASLNISSSAVSISDGIGRYPYLTILKNYNELVENNSKKSNTLPTAFIEILLGVLKGLKDENTPNT